MASAASIRPSVAAAIASSALPAVTSASTSAALVRVGVSRPRSSSARHHWTVRSGWSAAKCATLGNPAPPNGTSSQPLPITD